MDLTFAGTEFAFSGVKFDGLTGSSKLDGRKGRILSSGALYLYRTEVSCSSGFCST